MSPALKVAQFYRDEYLKNLTITEAALEELNDELVKVKERENENMRKDRKPHAESNIELPIAMKETKDEIIRLNEELNQMGSEITDEISQKRIELIQTLASFFFLRDEKSEAETEEGYFIEKDLRNTYVIRFDKKGLLLSDFNEFKDYFKKAKQVERVVLTLSSTTGAKSIEMRFDSKDLNNCFLSVRGDDKEWTDSNFTKFQDIIHKNKNRHGLIQNVWVGIAMRLALMLILVSLTVLFANMIAPHLKMANSFFLSFIVVLLIFQQLWDHIIRAIVLGADKLLPSIAFRQRKHPWLQAFVIGGMLALVFQFITYVWGIFSQEVFK